MAREDNGGPKSSPVGTWELMSFTSHLEDGSSIEPWPNAVGRTVYDASGNVTGLLMSGRRNEADGRSSLPAAQDEFSAYFGKYHVDIAQGVITHDVSASLSATRASKVLRRNFELNDDKLILGFATTRTGVPTTNRLVWKRISTAEFLTYARGISRHVRRSGWWRRCAANCEGRLSSTTARRRDLQSGRSSERGDAVMSAPMAVQMGHRPARRAAVSAIAAGVSAALPG